MRRTAILIASTLLLLTVACDRRQSARADDAVEPRNVRPPACAGTWYPGEERALAAYIDKALAAAKPDEALGDIIALIAPHAGVKYSGATAAKAYALLGKLSPRTVVILAPTHHVGFYGASVPPYDAYRTPLGVIPVDRDVCDALLKSPFVQSVAGAHQREHSVEMHLPFLQRALKGFKIVPVVIGQLRPADQAQLAESIRKAMPAGSLVIASSDFTHYGPRFGFTPFAGDVRESVRKLDMGAVEKAVACDADAWRAYCARTHATICGRGPIGVLLDMLPKGAKGTLLGYATSGEATDDWQNFVAYAAIAFTAPEGEIAMPEADQPLTDAEKAALLTIARRALEHAVRSGNVADKDAFRDLVTPALKKDGAVFVTLTINGNLRGCIGSLEARRPLYVDVIEHAFNAAMRDPRFRRVSPRELDAIRIEISYLTPAEPIKSLHDMVVGTHGLIIEKGGRRAVYLPQVAPEQGWDRIQTAQHLCRKAGLPPDAWKEGATLKVFRAIVFHEDE